MTEAMPLKYLIILLASPILVLILHILLLRLLKAPSPQLIAVFAVLLGYPSMAAIVWWASLRHISMGLELLAACLYGVLVYGSLSYAYFHLFNMGETARRFRILYELKARGKMTSAEIDARYSPQSMLTVRLERLLASGQLEQREGRYFLRSRFLYRISQLLTGWGRLLRLPVEIEI